MKTTFTNDNGNFVMQFEGRLDTSASFQVERDMKVLYECDGHDIILDCTQLEYISSSGLRLFLSVLKNAKARGSHVCIVGLSDTIKQVFDEIGFTCLFDIR